VKRTTKKWIAGVVAAALLIGGIVFWVHVENQRRSCWMKSGKLVWINECVITGDYDWKTHRWERWSETP
jgi:hypothetical protein